MVPHLYYSYIRVSTLRQGQTGTSLDEQHAAITRYAERHNLQIVDEFEEKETAAKRGRPVFEKMLKGLKQGRARGVIMHKIDRSARNLKDWADLGELIDCGIEVHFANESLDLQSRGGRLSADIQAVVAADYIRNLREETKKGFYGRLRQGLYPRPAPLGYLNGGKGALKQPDPARAPLIRQAFELYATGEWPLKKLVEELYALGLRNQQGKKVTLNGLSTLLHNPFYMGLIHVKITGEFFEGAHQPLVSKQLFERVQQVLAGKNIEKKTQHSLLFRKLIKCSSCQKTLIGERQKGHVYYRCQNPACEQKSIREELIEEAFLEVLKTLRFTTREMAFLRQQTKQMHHKYLEFKEEHSQTLRLQLDQVRERLSKLTDALIDGTLEKDLYIAKKNHLLTEEREFKERLENLDVHQQTVVQRIEQFLELANNAYSSYKSAAKEDKRDLVEIITSNLTVEGKKVIVKLNYPFKMVVDRLELSGGSPQRVEHRTLLALLSQLSDYFKENSLPRRDERLTKWKVVWDQNVLVSAKKITGHKFTFGHT